MVEHQRKKGGFFYLDNVIFQPSQTKLVLALSPANENTDSVLTNVFRIHKKESDIFRVKLVLNGGVTIKDRPVIFLDIKMMS